MDFRISDTLAGPRQRGRLPATATAAVKIVIVGGFGVGKTTMVGSVSEIRPLTTEETMTQAGVGVDDNAGVERKTATTVAMDFGRISINERAGALPLRHTRPGALLVPVERPVRGRARAPSCSSTPAGWRSASTSWAVWRSAACPSSSPSTPSPDAPVLPRRGAARAPSTCPTTCRSWLRRTRPRLQPGRPDDPRCAICTPLRP